MRRKILLCRFLLLWYKREWKSMIDQIISLFSSQFSKLANHKSLELEIVVKRVVLVYLLCFVVLLIH